MLTLIPFVPANNDTIPADLYQVARDAWCSQLTALLDNTSDDDFLHAIQENTSLHDFVSAVLNAQMDGHSVDREVSKRVFFIFYRASQLKAKGGALLTIDRLSSFAVSYQEANPEQVRTIFAALLKADPRLEDAVRSSFTALLGCLTTLQSSDDINPDHDQRVYVVVRLLEALTSACIDTAPHEGIIDALFHCYPTLKRKNDSGPTLYLIKRALVNILNYAVDCLYFDPIRYAKDGNVIDEFSKRLLGWIEKSHLDTTYHAFIDGPLVMDWQIECSVSNTLGDINKECFNGYPFLCVFVRHDSQHTSIQALTYVLY
ncbi:hypothetical protein O0I10_004545 [Lichtheimia ornata]|uniref:Uncharacterized protein n=1 Tax=Lichtheimia ornata TaxID=688661 RepID=A0AAD7V564_9FUNG|nr:uncharacterized protein O0I10_004545 [Lichtheimia ornata]KAJ8659568.1 hypothetical protein O0I10_004545 [Lichtheimia ornata]